MLFVGVDPGVSGGIAIINDDGALVDLTVMPRTERDLLDVFLPVGRGTLGARAVLERVHSMPKQGHNGAFTFGRSYGHLQMALTAARIPFDEVTPGQWQKAMGCLTGGDKNISKRRAQQLFPTVPKITHAVADALLLAAFCRRIVTEREGSHVRQEDPRARDQHPTGDRAPARTA